MSISTVLLRPSLRQILWLLALFSALMLSFALIGQYGFGWHPCELCLAQRYPYAAIIAVSLASIFTPPRPLRYLVIFCIALLLLDAGIAAYHAGVEWGFFKAPDACASNASGGQTIEEMRAQILGAPLVTCDQAMAHIFGLSLAAWNALLAAGMAIITIFLLRRAT